MNGLFSVVKGRSGKVMKVKIAQTFSNVAQISPSQCNVGKLILG